MVRTTDIDSAMTQGNDLAADLGDVIERFDHVSVAVQSIGSAASLLRLVGASHFDGGISSVAAFRWDQYRLPGAGVLELIAPLDPDDATHFINRFIEERGEGLHHLTFKVRDLDLAIARAEGLGFAVVGVDTSDAEWKEAFVHPKSANGVLIQLAEFPSDH
jgi:methylmalonyl-CoA/ethylmalonyl-CoA epimerase